MWELGYKESWVPKNWCFWSVVHTISVLYRAHLCMKCSLHISNFLEEISSLSHSVVFLYFFALITEYSSLLFFGTLYSNACIFPFLLCLHCSSLSAICKTISDNHFAFSHFFFLGMILIPVSCTMSQTSIHSSSDTLSIRSGPLNLFLTSTVSSRDLI